MHILLAEDDQNIHMLAKQTLEQAGFSVDSAFTATETSKKLKTNRYDLAILAWCFRGELINGMDLIYQICRTKPDLPVLVLTSKKAIICCISGVSCMADDFLLKPFHLPLLTEKTQNLLRRGTCRDCRQKNLTDCTINANGLVLNPKLGKATLKGKILKLSQREFELLKLLLMNLGRTINRSEITKKIWGQSPNLLTSNTIDVHIRRIRKKLGRIGRGIRTIHGVGYRFDPC